MTKATKKKYLVVFDVTVAGQVALRGKEEVEATNEMAALESLRQGHVAKTLPKVNENLAKQGKPVLKEDAIQIFPSFLIKI